VISRLPTAGDVLTNQKEHRMASAKALKNAARKRVEEAYYRSCSGVQIDIMDISKVFAVGEKAVAEGADDTALEAAIVDFVQTIRKN
jgi:hypothetical protein